MSGFQIFADNANVLLTVHIYYNLYVTFPVVCENEVMFYAFIINSITICIQQSPFYEDTRFDFILKLQLEKQDNQISE